MSDFDDGNKWSWQIQQDQAEEIKRLKEMHKIKNERIMRLVSLFTCLSSQVICEEPELSDEFYKKLDDFHSVLINIELGGES